MPQWIDELSRLTEVLAGEAERAASAVDGLLPEAVLYPASEAEVAACLAAASRHGIAICPRGAGTAVHLGNSPRRLDAVLSLERLNRVLAYVPEDLTITVQAGLSLGELQKLVAGNGQEVALEAAVPAATVGGLIATGAVGPRRAACGGPRDLLLGTLTALADGRVVKTGGRVVKNVAGYDMNKLLVGSLGTLGVITEVTLKLRPVPAAGLTLRLGCEKPGTALAAAEQILNSELLPVALTLLSPGTARRLAAPGPWTLAVELAESAANVAYQAQRIGALVPGPWERLVAAEGFWARVRNYLTESRAAYSLRVSTVTGELERQVAAAGPGPDLIAHVGAGTVLLYGFDSDLGAAAAQADRTRAAGGAAVLEYAPAASKRGVDVWGPPRPEWRLMRSIKQALDPTETLNPGRYAGGI